MAQELRSQQSTDSVFVRASLARMQEGTPTQRLEESIALFTYLTEHQSLFQKPSFQIVAVKKMDELESYAQEYIESQKDTSHYYYDNIEKDHLCNDLITIIKKLRGTLRV